MKLEILPPVPQVEIRNTIKKIEVCGIDGVILPKSFWGWGDLEEVTIGEGVTEIGEGAFCLCKSLRKVILPPTLKKISPRSFEGCYSLREIELPASLEEIGYNAFSWCYDLKEMTVPPLVEFIGYDAFFRCTSLERVLIPDDTFVDRAFGECDAKIEKYRSLEKAKKMRMQAITDITNSHLPQASSTSLPQTV